MLRGGNETALRHIGEHPCFCANAVHRFARIHLPVAPQCNVTCRFCDRKLHCVNESRPGVCHEVISPAEALERTIAFVRKEPRLSVVGIAGPGDSLANAATFETMRLVHQRLPGLIKCLSTNGLLLPEKIDMLCKLGVRAITVTVNACSPGVGSRIYSSINYNNRTYHGREAASILLNRQAEGLEDAVRRGLAVKVNTILMPGINDGEVLGIAELLRGKGVNLMNLTPLIPLGEFASFRSPSKEELRKARKLCGRVVKIFKHCQQCRADAAGLIGERDRDGQTVCTGG